MIDPYEIIDKYYPAGTPLRDIYLRHCRAVADEALVINRKLGLGLDEAMVNGAALLHDIGIFMTHAPSIFCFGTYPYIAHGILGAELLRREGAPQEWASVAEHHTGAGLTASEIKQQNLPLPQVDMLPQSLLERLICYADKFYSKSGDMKRKSPEQVRASMIKFGPETLCRFDALAGEFSA